MKKKYTIIHSVCISRHLRCFKTEYARVETDNLAEELENYNAWFVFEGWPKLEGEDNEN